MSLSCYLELVALRKEWCFTFVDFCLFLGGSTVGLTLCHHLLSDIVHLVPLHQQATGSRMRASSALAIVSTTERVPEGGERVRACNLYLYEGGDPGGKTEYTQRFNHDDARAPLLNKGTNLPSVNMEVRWFIPISIRVWL